MSNERAARLLMSHNTHIQFKIAGVCLSTYFAAVSTYYVAVGYKFNIAMIERFSWCEFVYLLKKWLDLWTISDIKCDMGCDVNRYYFYILKIDLWLVLIVELSGFLLLEG